MFDLLSLALLVCFLLFFQSAARLTMLVLMVLFLLSVGSG